MITNLNIQNNNLIYLRRSLACIYIQIRLCLSEEQFSNIGDSSKDICDVLKKMFIDRDEQNLNNHEINLIGMISDYILKHQFKKVKKIELDTPQNIVKWFSGFLRSKYPKEILSNSASFKDDFLRKIINEAKLRSKKEF